MPLALSVIQVAEYLRASYEGDGDSLVEGIADLKTAGPTHLSFLAKKQFGLTVVRVEDPYLAYAQVSGLFVKREPNVIGVHPRAWVSDLAQVHPSAQIGANCVVEAGARIGEGTELQAGVFVGQNSVVGKHCLIYANVSIYHGVQVVDQNTSARWGRNWQQCGDWSQHGN